MKHVKARRIKFEFERKLFRRAYARRGPMQRSCGSPPRRGRRGCKNLSIKLNPPMIEAEGGRRGEERHIAGRDDIGQFGRTAGDF